ncbi:Telomerase-binding protein [Exophiala xenobiotica]|uniref:Telomerase-binding protein n=1 Tax=Lithohypha guttulata TaxID=1690604 RepID=A0ABR0K1K4_9EURO|nr:Telomerase-binding protein [Lithohypha guttulata]KAK5311545.1 Telomerase-binding protein [Exophiala xenobiotica]
MSYKQSWLDFEKASGGRIVLKGSPEEIKQQYEDLVAMLMPHMPKPSENVESKDGEVDGVKYRVYNPKNASGSLPIATWTHGGGFMTGDVNTDDVLCRAVCEHTNSVVVNIDYSLTPEAKWPTQLNECVKVYKWAHDNAGSIGGDAKKMYTIGGSAGGALALQICNAVLKDPSLKDSMKGVAAMVPCTSHPDNVPDKYKPKYKSYTENAEGVPIIDRKSMEIFYEYLGADPNDPSCYTLLATDNHKNFPPVYLTSCEFDPLRDDAYVMEAALKEAGVDTKHDHYPGLPHYFWIFPGVAEGPEFINNMLQGIGWLQSKM